MASAEAKAHLRRAKRAYRSALQLRRAGLIEDAYSRAYYALLHLGFALLLDAGEPLPKTHGGLVTKLYAHSGQLRLTKDTVKKISKFQSLSANSDYSPVPAISAGDLDDVEKVLKPLFERFGVPVE